MPNYVVVMRGPSGVRIPIDGPPLLLSMPCSTGKVDLTIRTYLSEEGFEAPIPRGIWIDARGEAPSLDEAVTSFWNAAQAIMSLLAVSVNANSGPIEPELAYDNSPGSTKREFFQKFISPEKGIPSQGRPYNKLATVALFKALNAHPDSERLLRAIVQYHIALGHWKTGHETLCLAHLFMGMETLTVSGLRHELARLAKTENELAEAWEIRDDRDRKPKLLAEVRKRILFQGDEAAHKTAKAASDGFEHGYSKFGEVHRAAKEARDKTGFYLRNAILDISGIDRTQGEILKAEPFRTPLETWRPEKCIRGYILGNAPHLGTEDREYPILRWTSTIKSVSRNPDGTYNMVPDEKFTVMLGKGLSFQPLFVEIWGPRRDEAVKQLATDEAQNTTDATKPNAASASHTSNEKRPRVRFTIFCISLGFWAKIGFGIGFIVPALIFVTSGMVDIPIALAVCLWTGLMGGAIGGFIDGQR